MKNLLTATVLFFSITVAASAAQTPPPAAADVLAGGPVYSSDQQSLLCFYINMGPASITPTAQELFKLSSASPIASLSICPNGSAVAPGQTCYIGPTGSISSAESYACKVTFSTTAKQVRGVVELENGSSAAVATSDMH